jgi:translocation and assembly module TamA
LSFDGNQAFDDDALKEVIVTEATGILPWARKRYFNREAFDADLERLRAFYTDRGYPSATVDGVDVSFNETRDEVRIRIVISEGAPLIVERVEIAGLEALGPEIADAVQSTALAEGAPLDRQQLLRSREQAAFALKDRGFPEARVEVADREGSAADRRIVTVTVHPGALSTFGRIATAGLDEVQPAVVRRTLAFHPGDTYRESQVLESQRRLAALGVFDFAHVGRERAGGPAAADARAADRPTAETPAVTPIVTIGEAQGADAVPMRITVAEADPTRLRLGLGYGTEDGPRGSLDWQHTNFLGSARRLAADAKYSQRLQNVGVEVLQPYIFNRNLSVRGHAGATWARELDYSSRRVGGRGSLEFRRHTSRGLDREPIEHVIRATYSNEALQYGIRSETLADLSRLDELIALGFDPVTGNGSGRLGALEVDFERNEVDRLLDPRAGYSLNLHVARAATWLGGTYDYTETLGDVRAYLPVGGAVVAARLRAGGLMAKEETAVPFSARYFLGGSSSLRGWGRYQVAPLTSDGLPIGGRGMLETSAELRLPISAKIGAVAFVDAGNVWSDRSGIDLGDLRVSVGPGLRYSTPVGVVRADVGYQLTPIEGLVLNGQPERRRWRIHLSIGEAF